MQQEARFALSVTNGLSTDEHCMISALSELVISFKREYFRLLALT